MKRTALLTLAAAAFCLFAYDYWQLKQELAQANKVARFAASKAIAVETAIERQGIPPD